MDNNRKKKNKGKFLESFGNIKDDSFYFDQIESYFRNKDNSNSLQVLSDKTCNDLDFEELFMFLDRTNSKVGQQYLYNKLRVIPTGPNDFDKQEKTIASLLSLIMLFFNPNIFFVFLGIFIVNFGVHYWNKKNLYRYLGSIPQLLKLNAVACELYKKPLLQEINPNLAQSIAIINKVRNRMSFFNLETKLQSDIQLIFWGIFELFKILFLLEPLLLFNTLRELDTRRKEIEEVFTFVGQTDSFLSTASLRKGLDVFCIPEITAEKQVLVATETYHPLIYDCVKNSIRLNGKSILLTGSNMSGKTSFIRTIGINIITGLTLNTCFAEEFAMPRVRVYSAIRISDDLLNDKSYYFEEVLTIKDMIDKCGTERPNIFLLDEIFKGTNTVERISAGKAVLSVLARDNMVFVSTHDIELADLLKNEYELYHFSENVNNKTVDFDYKVKEGKLKNRNAIRILQINNYPENVIKEAIEISKELDKNTEIQSNPL